MLDVTCATSQRHGPLTVFPLIATRSPTLPYILMADALMSGSMRITELGSGSVPELVATNSGDRDVLILDGEQLIGAKQNRTTNRSLILPAKSETRIPVSCMEQGRWRHTGDDFKSAKQNSPSTVRRKTREAEAGYAGRSVPAPIEVLAHAQGAVWSSIADYSSKVRAHSATGALDDVFKARDNDLEAWVRSFPHEPRQIGLLAFVGNNPLGVDVIGCTELYRSIHDRLVRGYIMDALAMDASAPPPETDRAQAYLGGVNGARRVPSPSVGLGEYSVLVGDVIGAELSANGALVHLSAFPRIEQPNPGQFPDGRTMSPISPPSRRRHDGMIE